MRSASVHVCTGSPATCERTRRPFSTFAMLGSTVAAGASGVLHAATHASAVSPNANRRMLSLPNNRRNIIAQRLVCAS